VIFSIVLPSLKYVEVRKKNNYGYLCMRNKRKIKRGGRKGM
jgi:hypothetical protein